MFLCTSRCIVFSVSLFLPLLPICSFSENTLASDHFPQNNRAFFPFLHPRGLLSSGLFGSNVMPCRCRRLDASGSLCLPPSSSSLLFLISFASTKRLSSNQLTRSLHHSVLQGHILPSQVPRHPRPAPLVLQVLVSQHVIDWGEGFGVLGLPTPFSHVLSWISS